MQIHSGKFSNPQSHHAGYFKVFRFTGAVEIWLGSRWYLIQYKSRR